MRSTELCAAGAILWWVQRRVKAKQEKAAAVVQYYWKNRLNLGAGANMFAELIAQRKRKNEEEKAKERALRRAEAEQRLQEEMGAAARRAQKNRRGKALSRALRERAAVDTLQCAVRRCLGQLVKRRLRVKRAQFLRSFTNDATGRSMRLLIVFQRRVRLWLAHNAIYLSYYEDHRRNLHNTLCQPYFDEIEKEITSRLKAMEPTLEAAMKAVRELSEAPSSEADLRVKLAEARGELKALEEVENGNGPKRDADLRRGGGRLGAASGQLEV